MNKTYDITKIEELHRLREDNHEETRHLTPDELIERSRKAAERYFKRRKEAHKELIEPTT